MEPPAKRFRTSSTDTPLAKRLPEDAWIHIGQFLDTWFMLCVVNVVDRHMHEIVRSGAAFSTLTIEHKQRNSIQLWQFCYRHGHRITKLIAADVQWKLLILFPNLRCIDIEKTDEISTVNGILKLVKTFKHPVSLYLPSRWSPVIDLTTCNDNIGPVLDCGLFRTTQVDHLPHVRRLDVYSTKKGRRLQQTQQCIASLLDRKRLTSLWLQLPEINSLLPVIYQQHQLQTLSLADVHDASLDFVVHIVQGCPDLKQLILNYCFLTHNDSLALGELRHLKRLEVFQCELSHPTFTHLKQTFDEFVWAPVIEQVDEDALLETHVDVSLSSIPCQVRWLALPGWRRLIQSKDSVLQPWTLCEELTIGGSIIYNDNWTDNEDKEHQQQETESEEDTDIDSTDDESQHVCQKQDASTQTMDEDVQYPTQPEEKDKKDHSNQDCVQLMQSEHALVLFPNLRLLQSNTTLRTLLKLQKTLPKRLTTLHCTLNIQEMFQSGLESRGWTSNLQSMPWLRHLTLSMLGTKITGISLFDPALLTWLLQHVFVRLETLTMRRGLPDDRHMNTERSDDVDWISKLCWERLKAACWAVCPLLVIRLT